MLPFDNLTADASLDWISSAAPAVLTEQLTGAVAVMPVRAATVGDAYAAKAVRLVHGYFDRRGDVLHFELVIEDAGSHKMVTNMSWSSGVTGAVSGNLLLGLNSVVQTIDPTGRSFSTSNPEALAAWGQGDYQRAVSIDSNFTGAWVNWVQTRMSAGDAKGALEIANQALMRISRGSSPIDRAQLELLAATLRQDESARGTALVTLSHYLPNDPGVAQTLADFEMNARQFSEAVKTYQDLLRLDPDQFATLNMLGYAQAFAGDLEGARKTLEQYGRAPGQEANSLDSLGEAMFLQGKFAEAENYFVQAHAKNSALEGGGDLLKAAYAQWLQGDLAKADVLFGQYQMFRTQLRDPVLFWREAVWQYSTGRTEQAIKMLENVSGAGADLASKQLAVWHNPTARQHDPAIFKSIYERTPPNADGLVRTLYAEALMDAGRTEEAKRLIVLWPLPGAGENDLLRGFLYPIFLELRQRLK